MGAGASSRKAKPQVLASKQSSDEKSISSVQNEFAMEQQKSNINLYAEAKSQSSLDIAQEKEIEFVRKDIDNSSDSDVHSRLDEPDFDNEYDEDEERDNRNNEMTEEDMEASAEMFANTAMSLGMENDELLFNLMYFGDMGCNDMNFSAVVSNALDETVALHSANNTPYKLHPASLDKISYLATTEIIEELDEDKCECAVCKDIMCIGDQTITLPICHHQFHADCITRWLKLQGWCPFCRAPIDEEGSDAEAPAVPLFQEQEVSANS